jgi:hypothetical protein
MANFNSSVIGFRQSIFGKINKLGVSNLGKTKKK